MTIPTNIREEIASIRTLLSGIDDSLRTIDGLLPPEPPPPPPPLPEVSLNADVTTITPDAPEVSLNVSLSAPATADVIATMTPSRSGIQLDWVAVIPAGALFVNVPLRVTEFPPAGEFAEFNVEVTAAENATIGVGSKVTFRVDGPQIPPPPPVPPVITLSAPPEDLREDSPAVEITATLSVPWSADIQVDLAVRADDPAKVDDELPEIFIPAGQLSGSVPVTVTKFPEFGATPVRKVYVGIWNASVGEFSEQPIEVTVRSVREPTPPVDPPPVDPPPPTPEPTFPPTLGTVAAAHPRLLDPAQRMDRITPAVWTRVIAAAERVATSPQQIADQALCGAAIWRCGTVAGQTYKLTREQYRDRAVAALVALASKPIGLTGGHYAWFHLHPVALGYDWLHDVLTEEQRAAVRGTIEQALLGTWDGQVKLDLMRQGYNIDAGSGMVLALAIHGEMEIDWVSRYWNDVWWSVPPASAKGVGGFYNREYEMRWQPDGGTREGWTYLSDQAGIHFARGCYEFATGDKTSLAYPWFDRVPLLLLHQTMARPSFTTTGRPNGYRAWSMPNYSYGGEYMGQSGFVYMLAACTGGSDQTIASLAAWMAQRWNYSPVTGCEELVFRCLIGDPRVAPKSPEELNLPLTYTTRMTGLHYDRTDWSDDSLRVFFGSGEVQVRDWPKGDISIIKAGIPLVGSRTELIQHHYAGPERRSYVLLRSGDKWILPAGGDSTPRRIKAASFYRDGDWLVSETQGLYGNNASLVRRKFQHVAGTVTVVDEIQVAEGVKPIILWQTPLEPVVGETITLNNGRDTALMSFDAVPTEILVRGGLENQEYLRLYDGTMFDATKLETGWVAAAPEEQIRSGGYYAVYVTPPVVDGVFKLVTTIKVDL